MAKLDDLLEELVTANRILASQGIVDSFGHVSIRHPDNPKRYFLSRARAPERVEIGDIMEFTLEGDPIDKKKAKKFPPYTERFIHGAIYELRPDLTPEYLKKEWNRPKSAAEGAKEVVARLREEVRGHRLYVEYLGRQMNELDKTAKQHNKEEE